MGNPTIARQIIAGVANVVAETGDTVTITRNTVTRDPSNPTAVNTVQETYTAEAVILEPRKQYIDGTVVQIEDAEVYFDLISVRDSGNNLVNTIDSITFVTENGDKVTSSDDSVNLTLLDNRAPRVSGRQVTAFHDARR